MVSNYFAAMERLHVGLPLLIRLRQAAIKILKALLEIRHIFRIHLSQFSSNPLRTAASVVRIEPVVGIPEGMHISHGSGDRALRDLQDLGRVRSVQVAVRPNLDAGVAALSDQWRQPPDL